jgi:hypothetical protein
MRLQGKIALVTGGARHRLGDREVLSAEGRFRVGVLSLGLWRCRTW